LVLLLLPLLIKINKSVYVMNKHNKYIYKIKKFPKKKKLKNKKRELTTNMMDRYDHTLWEKITELGNCLEDKSGDKYYSGLVDAANDIQSPDLRFSTLVEIGNLAAIDGSCEAFQKASNYLLKIVSSASPDIALERLKKQMQSYCFTEKVGYIPDYMECWNNRGALEILIRIAPRIKGGNKVLRNETATLCRILLQKLKEFKKK